MDRSQVENESLYGLLAMAEHFMSAQPQRIPEALQCWIASLSLRPPACLRSITCCKIGLTLYHYTSNLEEAKTYLNEAKITEQGMEPSDTTFEAHCLLAQIYCEQSLPQQAKVVLKGLLDRSLKYPYWHLRFLFQLTDVSVCERDNQAVIAYLSKASDYAALIKADYPRLLSLLSQGAYQLTVGKYPEGAQALNQCGQLLEGYSGPRGPSLKAFYLVIQVTHLLWAGQPKSAKPHLRQLQHCIKEIDSEPPHLSSDSPSPLNVNSFDWLSKEQLYALIYLVCMMYNLQAGNTDKVIVYGEKASAVMAQQQNGTEEGSSAPRLWEGGSAPRMRDGGMMKVLKAYVLEHIMAAKLMQGKYSEVSPLLEEVLCVCYGHSKLVYSHRALIHLFLGFYAYHNDVLHRAAAQFSCALQHTNVPELKTFITLNLALTYVRMGAEKESELSAVMETLRPEGINPVCQGLRAAVLYMNGLHAYLTLKINDAKHCLREALLLTNSNDLHKLTACCLVLLGQIYFALGNKEAAHNMVKTSNQLANKMPDTALQSWSLGLLGYLDQENGTQSHWGQLDFIKSQMMAERNKASSTTQFQLIQWAVGEWPVCVRQRTPEKKEEDHSSLPTSHKGLIPFGNIISPSALMLSPLRKQPVLQIAVLPKLDEMHQLKGKTTAASPLQLTPALGSSGPLKLSQGSPTWPSGHVVQSSHLRDDVRKNPDGEGDPSHGRDITAAAALPSHSLLTNKPQKKKQASPHAATGPLSPPPHTVLNHSLLQNSEAPAPAVPVSQPLPQGAGLSWAPVQPQPHPQGSSLAGNRPQPAQPLPPNVYAMQQYQQQVWLQQQLAHQSQQQQEQLVRQAQQQQQLVRQAQQQQQQQQELVRQAQQQQQQQRQHALVQQQHFVRHAQQQQLAHQAQQQQLLLQTQQQQQQLAHQAQQQQRASEQVKQQLAHHTQQQVSKQQLPSWPPIVSALPTSPPSASTSRRGHAAMPSLQPQSALLLGSPQQAGPSVEVQGRTGTQQQQLYASPPYFHQTLGHLQLPHGYHIQPPQ